MKQEKLDKCFGWFLEMLKKQYMNIPFIEVLTQMPAYAKFMKEILSSKRKLEEITVVKLNAHCSAILQNKISQKCGDPGSFTIPYSLGSEKFDKALCDYGISINLISLYVFIKVEDIIMVDMKANKDVPQILGRPFLCTGIAILDICDVGLILGVSNEKVVFQMKRMMKYPSEESSDYSRFKLDVVGKLAEKYKCIGTKAGGDAEKEWLSSSMIANGSILCKWCLRMRYASGYNQIPIVPEDVEKTTFTCPGDMNRKCLETSSTNFYEEHKELLGRAGLYRKFIKNFSCITKPLTTLLAKDDKFVFIVKFLRAFKLIKEKLGTALIMVKPDWSQPFKIMCDSSDVAVGAALGQRKDKMFRPIYYTSRTLNNAQVKYATIKKEFFVVVFDFEKFRSYLVGSKEGTKNHIADHISQLERPLVEIVEIREGFPDDQIFSIAVVSERRSWYADVANILANGWLPRDRSRDQIRKLQGEYILVAIDYVSKWAEGIPTTINDSRVVCEFLQKNIFICFGTPRVIISDNRSHFVNKAFAALLSKLAGEHKLLQMNKLEEFRLDAYENERIFKKKTKRWHDHLIKPNEFHEGANFCYTIVDLGCFPKNSNQVGRIRTMSRHPSKRANTGSYGVAPSSRRGGRREAPDFPVEEDMEEIDPEDDVVLECKFGIRVVLAHARHWYTTFVTDVNPDLEFGIDDGKLARKYSVI
ncbi:uncharacterized protein [Nicotiana sylvestris]|uniref:uncharacterized protein n=1 Tax=Nicotiana sylvestris TaxID=4096 RepID=UPI00388C41C1